MNKNETMEEGMEKADIASRTLATHLFNMGASKIEEDIHILETPDTFRLVLERIPPKKMPDEDDLPSGHRLIHDEEIVLVGDMVLDYADKVGFAKIEAQGKYQKIIGMTGLQARLDSLVYEVFSSKSCCTCNRQNRIDGTAWVYCGIFNNKTNQANSRFDETGETMACSKYEKPRPE